MNSQKQERMIVFILGNGFDLAHGLKTRYTDFLAADPKEELQKNIWFKYFNEIKEQIGENWFNLEQAIYNVIMNEVRHLEPPYHNTQKVKAKAKGMYDSLRFFVDQFGKYLLEQLKNPDLTQKQKFLDFLKNKILKEYNKIRIVNFNYTNTFEKLYRDYLYREDSTLDIRTYYVHGSLEENNLVLGTKNLLDLD